MTRQYNYEKTKDSATLLFQKLISPEYTEVLSISSDFIKTNNIDLEEIGLSHITIVTEV